MIPLIYPDWPAPDHIRACTTTRQGGSSSGSFASCNLGLSSGDHPDTVLANRQQLATQLDCPAIHWIHQTHSNTVVSLPASDHPKADASFTRQPHLVCAVMTADCLPVLLTNRTGTFVAAIHAGWRGLAADILAQTLSTIDAPPETLLAWLGPAISQAAFTVGQDVYDAFCSDHSHATQAFLPTSTGQYQACLYTLARQKLQHAGVTAIYGGDYCTFSDPKRFFSYRREHPTGRMASLIWIA